MALEIEKKCRLTKRQRDAVLRRLPEMRAKLKTTEFEVNTLYNSDVIDLDQSILRLRRIGASAVLTYKERFPTASTIKHQREEETEVSDADALEAILQALEFFPALVYEKRRQTWHLGDAEIAIDELPFGLFMEIEANEEEIRKIESELSIKGLRPESATYPQLTFKHGKDRGGVIEARFSKKERSAKKIA